MPDDVQGKVDELLDGVSKNSTTDSEYEKVKASNDRLEAELNRQEQLRTKQMLGGKSINQQIPEKTKEQLADERASEILARYGK
jgi:flagellar motor switch protein FliM